MAFLLPLFKIKLLFSPFSFPIQKTLTSHGLQYKIRLQSTESNNHSSELALTVQV